MSYVCRKFGERKPQAGETCLIELREPIGRATQLIGSVSYQVTPDYIGLNNVQEFTQSGRFIQTTPFRVILEDQISLGTIIKKVSGL